MNKKISFAGPSITEKEKKYVLDALSNGWYENYDNYIKKLEKSFADYLGVKYAIAMHCCTHTLHVSALCLDFKKDDEVIVTDFSWIATAYAIAYTGAKCVFVDIEPNTWTIDPKAIENAITDKTKAIMIVHSFGQPAEMDEIMEIAKKHNLYVIEDAAPAIGSTYKGKKVGTFGDFGCFSFQGAKLTSSGEGGILVTNNEHLYNKALLYSNMGRTDSKKVFWSEILGHQYTINNLTASLALAQLERVEELKQIKRNIFNNYYNKLKNIDEIKIVVEKEYCNSNYCYPSILLKDHTKNQRDEILKSLKNLNIHARPAFPCMSDFPIFEEHYTNPISKEVENKGISLPSAANLTKEDIDFVCDSLISLL